MTQERKKGSRKAKPEYLTKRITERAAQNGVRAAAEETMKIMGYTIIAHEGWVVKKYQDGTIEKLSKIERARKPRKIQLD